MISVGHLLWLRHTRCSQDMASGFGHVSQPRIVLLLFPESILQTEGKTSPVDDVLQLKQSDLSVKMLALRMKKE